MRPLRPPMQSTSSPSLEVSSMSVDGPVRDGVDLAGRNGFDKTMQVIAEVDGDVFTAMTAPI